MMEIARTAKRSRASAGQTFHLFQRHSFVGFVVEVKRAAATRVVAHDTFENYGGAIFGAFQRGKNQPG